MAQPVTIVGTITDSSGISKQVTITGIGSVQVDPGYGVGTPVPPHPAHPIYTPPVFPSHPIVLPTPPVDPGYGVPLPPLGIWGGAPPAHIAHPIAPGGPPPIATPPIYYPPVYPAHPIVPPPVDPGYGVPLPPQPPGVATPPIYYPPEIWPNPPEPPEQPPVMPPGALLPPGWSWYWTSLWGWILVWRPPSGGGKPQPPGGGSPPVAQPK